MSHPNTCTQCGAPAEHFDPDVTTYMCKFCHTEFEVRHPDYENHRREHDKERARQEHAKKRSNSGGCLVPIFIFALIGLSAGGVFYYEEYMKPWQWDGHTSFTCSGGSGTFTNIQATGSVTARGYCNLTLVNPSMEASITVSDHAIVTVKGGRVHTGSATAVTAKGFGRVVLDGATVDARDAVHVKDSATVESKNATIKGLVEADAPSGLLGSNWPANASRARALSPR